MAPTCIISVKDALFLSLGDKVREEADREVEPLKRNLRRVGKDQEDTLAGIRKEVTGRVDHGLEKIKDLSLKMRAKVRYYEVKRNKFRYYNLKRALKCAITTLQQLDIFDFKLEGFLIVPLVKNNIVGNVDGFVG